MQRRLYTLYAILKALVAVPLLPALALLFVVSKCGFVAALTFLWPHLDIFTPEGELYLRRWFFFPKTKRGPCPRFLHLICLDDAGRDPHDHPGGFTTTILWNGYDEEIYFPRGCYRDDTGFHLAPQGVGRLDNPFVRKVRPGETYVNPVDHTHRVKLVGPTLTWVVGWKKGKPWGFWILHPTDPSLDCWVDSESYGEKGEERKSWTIDGK